MALLLLLQARADLVCGALGVFAKLPTIRLHRPVDIAFVGVALKHYGIDLALINSLSFRPLLSQLNCGTGVDAVMRVVFEEAIEQLKGSIFRPYGYYLSSR